MALGASGVAVTQVFDDLLAGRPDDEPERPVAPDERAPTRRERVLPWSVSTLLWGLGAGGLAAILLVVGLGFPEYLLLAVVGLAAAAICLRYPFVFAVVALIVVLFSYVLEGTLGSIGGMADELVIVVSFVVFTTRRIVVDRGIVIPPGTLWFAMFGMLGVISSLVNGVPTFLWTQAGFLALKGVILAFAFAQLDWTPKRIKVMIRVGVGLAIVLIVTGVINLVAPIAWAGMLGSAPTAPILGIRPLNGLFAHPAAFGRITAVVAVGILAYRFCVARGWFSAVLLALTTAMALLSFRVKTLVGLFATFTVMLFRFAKPSVVVTLAVVGPIVLMIVGPTVWWMISSDLDAYVFGESARSRITFGSLTVSAEHFPWGAGFGRYGSFLAAQFYSPEYRALGWSGIYGVGEGELGQFLMDTQWPALLGETGWFGTIAYAGGLVAMLVSLLKPVGDDESPYFRWVRVAGIGWIILLVIESIAAPVFVSPPSYPFLFLSAAIIASVRFSRKLSEKRAQFGLQVQGL
jgi:hypothetical protein